MTDNAQVDEDEVVKRFKEIEQLLQNTLPLLDIEPGTFADDRDRSDFLRKLNAGIRTMTCHYSDDTQNLAGPILLLIQQSIRHGDVKKAYGHVEQFHSLVYGPLCKAESIGEHAEERRRLKDDFEFVVVALADESKTQNNKRVLRAITDFALDVLHNGRDNVLADESLFKIVRHRVELTASLAHSKDIRGAVDVARSIPKNLAGLWSDKRKNLSALLYDAARNAFDATAYEEAIDLADRALVMGQQGSGPSMKLLHDIAERLIEGMPHELSKEGAECCYRNALKVVDVIYEHASPKHKYIINDLTKIPVAVAKDAHGCEAYPLAERAALQAAKLLQSGCGNKELYDRLTEDTYKILDDFLFLFPLVDYPEASVDQSGETPKPVLKCEAACGHQTAVFLSQIYRHNRFSLGDVANALYRRAVKFADLGMEQDAAQALELTSDLCRQPHLIGHKELLLQQVVELHKFIEGRRDHSPYRQEWGEAARENNRRNAKTAVDKLVDQVTSRHGGRLPMDRSMDLAPGG